MMLDLSLSFEHVQQKSIGLLNLLFVNYVSNVNAPALRYAKAGVNGVVIYM